MWRPARPGCRPHGRRAGRVLVHQAGRRARRRRGQLRQGPRQQDDDSASPNDTKPIIRQINNDCLDIPTELPGVVTVSATTRTEQLASFSNRGLGVIDVAAPGRTILSTVVANNGYGTKSGTSMASPHVAGVLALMKSVHPDWTPAQMVAKLRAQADDRACSAPEGGTSIPCTGPATDNSYYGEGIVGRPRRGQLTRRANGEAATRSRVAASCVESVARSGFSAPPGA